jgi:hypothetical protein
MKKVSHDNGVSAENQTEHFQIQGRSVNRLSQLAQSQFSKSSQLSEKMALVTLGENMSRCPQCFQKPARGPHSESALV